MVRVYSTVRHLLIECLTNQLPSVTERLEFFRPHGAVHRIWLLGALPALVTLERKLLKLSMTHKIKLIPLIGLKQNKNAQHVWIEKRHLAPNVLKIVNYLNLKKCIGLILPSATIDGLNLNGNRETALIGSE